MSSIEKLAEFTHAAEVSIADLETWFDTLAPLEEAFMLGEWRGDCFNTGHSGEAMLKQLNWRGKHFHSRTHVEPMLCADANGEVSPNNLLGTAQLREVVYRGISTATMVYDTQPIFDHFKKVDDSTVLGVMDRKGDELPLFFFLKRHIE
ncbi:MAG: DUF4334 domain-containing protein [Pseudomonadales bacterium]|nr:DUF4334 domain-containing protein [Pseudomonadales bacterium]